MNLLYFLPALLTTVCALNGEIKPFFVQRHAIVDIDPSLLHLLPQGEEGTDTRVLPAPGIARPFGPTDELPSEVPGSLPVPNEVPNTRVLPSTNGPGTQSGDAISAAFLLGQLQGHVSASQGTVEDSRERKRNKGKGKKKKKKNKNRNNSRERGQGNKKGNNGGNRNNDGTGMIDLRLQPGQQGPARPFNPMNQDDIRNAAGQLAGDPVAAAFLLGQLQGSFGSAGSTVEDSRERKKNKGKHKKKKKHGHGHSHERGHGHSHERGYGHSQERGHGHGKRKHG